ncbi:hypothetical protein [Bradyrhizobium sp. STM 3557]|uniref:hypothetical protein n=1 Tax=Bradyrhizobium sp. STM 3557 TaxID=578920 RepID=UPI00388E4716
MTLLILIMGTVVGATLWIIRQIRDMKKEILADFDQKHSDNAATIKALEQLVLRHDLILEPEFNGSGRSQYTARQRPRQ